MDFTKTNDDKIKGSNLQKNPDDWKTGNEPPTDAQLSYLQTLAAEANEQLDPTGMTKAEVAKKIDELQQKTGRNQSK